MEDVIDFGGLHGRCNGFWWIPDGSTVLKTMMTAMGTPMYLLKMPWMWFQEVSMGENALMIMDLLKLPWMMTKSSHDDDGGLFPGCLHDGEDDNGVGNALRRQESLMIMESMSQDDHEHCRPSEQWGMT